MILWDGVPSAGKADFPSALPSRPIGRALQAGVAQLAKGLVDREQVATVILYSSFDRFLGDVENTKDKTRKGHLHTNGHNAKTSGD
jgi:hypothetical protein